MSRLGGEFAVLMLASVPEERVADVEPALAALTGQGYKVTLSATKGASDESRAGWQSYRIEVRGADHEGIVHEIARGLSQQGISIESAETGTTEASVSGATLFTMTALVVVPPSVAEGDWIETLAEAGAVSNVDVEVIAT
jgi:glycine cleavage system transcriptional repressor